MSATSGFSPNIALLTRYVDDEDSDHEQLGGRARKRARKGLGSKPKKKPIRLDGILHVPMDIFTEVSGLYHPSY